MFGGSNGQTQITKTDAAGTTVADAVSAAEVNNGEKGAGYIEFSVSDPTSWKELWINQYESTTGTKTHLLRSPKYPSYKPNRDKYEVCIFQKESGADDWKYARCYWKDVGVTT